MHVGSFCPLHDGQAKRATKNKSRVARPLASHPANQKALKTKPQLIPRQPLPTGAAPGNSAVVPPHGTMRLISFRPSEQELVIYYAASVTSCTSCLLFPARVTVHHLEDSLDVLFAQYTE